METVSARHISKKDLLLERLRGGRHLSGQQRVSLTLLLCGPAFLAQLASVLLQFIDASMVGSLGANPAASIGLIATSTWLFGGFSYAICQGFSVQVAHLVGSNDFRGARQVLREGLSSCLGLSLIMAVIGVIISPVLPYWLGGSPEIAGEASEYFFIFSLSVPFMQVMWLCSTMLQCSGNIKLPSILEVVMCFLDVIFNFFLIFSERDIQLFGMELTVPGAGMGVKGAALGTCLAMAITAALMLWFTLIKSPILSLRGESGSFKPSRKVLKNAIGISGPICLQNIAMRGAYIAGTVIVAPLGPIALAANNLAIIAESVCYTPGYGLADAATTLVGQSIGAERQNLAKSFSRITMALGMGMMTLLGALLFFMAPQIMSLLCDDPDIISLGSYVLRIEAFAETMYAASIVAYGCCVGAGDTTIPSILNLSSMWIVRIGLAVWLTPKIGLAGYWIPMCIELNVRGILFLFHIRGKGWINKNFAR